MVYYEVYHILLILEVWKTTPSIYLVFDVVRHDFSIQHGDLCELSPASTTFNAKTRKGGKSPELQNGLRPGKPGQQGHVSVCDNLRGLINTTHKHYKRIMIQGDSIRKNSLYSMSWPSFGTCLCKICQEPQGAVFCKHLGCRAALQLIS
jgi:hypothetical protein